MNRTNSITIRAPLNKVFSAAADLARWPEFLPHYRYNRFFAQSPSGGTVKMSCVHAGVTLTWLSVYRIDTEKHQLHFRHPPSVWNGGMEVIWKFEELPDGGVRLVVTHELELRWPVIGRFVGSRVLGGFFVQRIAEKTLAGLKRKVEAQQRLTDQLAVVPALPVPASPRPTRKQKSERKAASSNKRMSARIHRTGRSPLKRRSGSRVPRKLSSRSGAKATSKASKMSSS